LREARNYYERIAEEVNAACDQGLLPCGAYRASVVPALRWDYLPIWGESFLRAIRLLVFYEQMTLAERESFGTPEGLRLFRQYTRTPLTPVATEASSSGLRLPSGPAARILEGICGLYHVIAPAVGVIGVIDFLRVVMVCFRRRHISTLLVITAAIGAAVLSRLALLSYLDVPLGPVLIPMYVAPAYPLYLVFCSLSCYAGFREFFRLRELEAATPTACPAPATEK
jgi:hypothetical protein